MHVKFNLQNDGLKHMVCFWMASCSSFFAKFNCLVGEAFKKADEQEKWSANLKLDHLQHKYMQE